MTKLSTLIHKSIQEQNIKPVPKLCFVCLDALQILSVILIFIVGVFALSLDLHIVDAAFGGHGFSAVFWASVLYNSVFWLALMVVLVLLVSCLHLAKRLGSNHRMSKRYLATSLVLALLFMSAFVYKMAVVSDFHEYLHSYETNTVYRG